MLLRCVNTRSALQCFRYAMRRNKLSLCAAGLALVLLLLYGVPYLFPLSWIFDHNPKLAPENFIQFQGRRIDPYTAKFVLLHTFFEQADKYHIKAFILDGALLGYLRYGSIMPWDHDIEIR